MNKPAIIEKALFCLIFLAGAYFYHPVEYDNSSTRYFQVSSVVDYGTLNIDNYEKYTSDKSYYDGHYYPNKAPGAQLIAVPVYGLIRLVKSDPSIPPLTPFDKYMIRLVTTTLPFAILGFILFRMGIRWTQDTKKSLWMVVAYSFGSIAFQHATIFTGHQIAASFSFFSFFILYTLSKRKAEESKFRIKHALAAFSAGLLVGVAGLCDYTAIFIAMVLTGYTLSIPISNSEKMFFIMGGFFCASLLAVYNLNCFGSVFSFSYGHQVTEQFKKGAETGLFGISLPNLKVLFSILFSTARGLFFIMPVFLMGIFGLITLYRNSDYRREMIVILVISVGYLLINSGFYGWHGGWIFGPRYLVPMLPFLALPIVCAPWDTKIFFLLIGLSVFQVGISVIGFPHTPEIIKNPIMEIIIPCMKYGYFSKNAGNWIGLKGMWSVLPILLAVSVCLFLMSRHIKQAAPAKALSLVQKTISLIWAGVVIIMLLYVRTTPERLVHENRGMLLQHVAITLRSRDLYNNAIYELRLAKDGL